MDGLRARASSRGSCYAIDNPARQAFVIEIVGPDRVVNAVALNSRHRAHVAHRRPGRRRRVIALLGVGPCFLLNALTFVAMIVALRLMDPRRAARRAASPARARASCAPRSRYVRAHARAARSRWR